MKRTALKRRTPLRRKSKPTKRAPRRVGREDAKAGQEYMALVRGLTCAARYWMGCTDASDIFCAGRMHAHHAGHRPGVGMKCSDFETIPPCNKHHQHLHGNAGAFHGWTKQRLREWSDGKIAATQRALGLDPTRAGTSKEGK